MRSEGRPVLNLGIGSPDLPPDPDVIRELSDRATDPDVHGYQSYTGIPELREAFAGWYRRYFSVRLDPESEILPLIGSKEGIMHIAMTYLEKGDEVLVPDPGYPAYSAVSRLTGATVRTYGLSAEGHWLPDLAALAATDLSRVKLMWVNYPHMPTGSVAPMSFFEQLIAFGKEQGILIVNDNPYAFILNDEPRSILAVPGARAVALELNSLSKAHNMAGWRVGMLAGRSDYITEILRFKSNMDSGMFRPLQLAAARALDADDAWYRTLNRAYRERRRHVFQLLDLLECPYDPEQVGMFVWAAIPEKYADAYALSDELLYGANVFITPGGIFGERGARYIRISLCSKIELYEEALRRVKALRGQASRTRNLQA